MKSINIVHAPSRPVAIPAPGPVAGGSESTPNSFPKLDVPNAILATSPTPDFFSGAADGSAEIVGGSDYQAGLPPKE